MKTKVELVPVLWGSAIEPQLRIIWEALHTYREKCIPDTSESDHGPETSYEEQWNDICMAMADIESALGVERVLF